MDVIKELVRNIVLIVLLTTILDMLLPSSSMRSYVKVVMGLFILVSLLNPILNLVMHDQEFEVFAWQQASFSPDASSIRYESEQLSAMNQELFLDNYARRLEIQMAALVKLIEGAQEVEVQVELKGGNKVGVVEGIEKVLVRINREQAPDEQEELIEIAPVRIEEEAGRGESYPADTPDGALSFEEEKIEKEIKNTLNQYFGVPLQQIIVVFLY